MKEVVELAPWKQRGLSKQTFSLFTLSLCSALWFSACSSHDDDLSLQCEGQRRVLRGNVEEPWTGVRQSQEDKTVTYALRGRKLEGEHECQVWNAQEIRCTHSKIDGSAQRQFVLERESLRVRDQTFTRGRSLTEEITFEGECKRL
jgi:hypothetical protein